MSPHAGPDNAQQTRYVGISKVDSRPCFPGGLLGLPVFPGGVITWGPGAGVQGLREVGTLLQNYLPSGP